MTIQDYLSYDTKSTKRLVSGGTATIKKREGRQLKAGGLWIYDNEIDSLTGDYENGDILSVLDFDGYFLGYGFVNTASTIRIRMLARRKEDVITPAFLYERVRAAWAYRKKVIDTSACRVIFGEADFLPGLTVDKYGDVLVVESLALGIDRLKTLCLACLVQVLAADGIRVRGIYERSDAKVREKEGMARTKGFLSEEFDTTVPITENGVKYLVDVKDGQKTGFFLDQKLNRLALAGARHVVSIDASDLAIAQARENAKLNGLEDRIDYVVGDVFSFLPEELGKGHLYDVVILDPPAFTKSRNSVRNASHGYREINRDGMKLVKDGGYLVTCSCSHFMEPQLFAEAIAQAAKDAHRRLRQVEFRQQAPDHPILWADDASYYLKFYIFQVADER